MDFHIGVLYYHQRNNCGSFSFTKLEHCGGHKILHTCTAITINCLVFEEIIRNWHRQCHTIDCHQHRDRWVCFPLAGFSARGERVSRNFKSFAIEAIIFPSHGWITSLTNCHTKRSGKPQPFQRSPIQPERAVRKGTWGKGRGQPWQCPASAVPRSRCLGKDNSSTVPVHPPRFLQSAAQQLPEPEVLSWWFSLPWIFLAFWTHPNFWH